MAEPTDYVVAYDLDNPGGAPAVVFASTGPIGGGFPNVCSWDPNIAGKIYYGADIGGTGRSSDYGKTFELAAEGLGYQESHQKIAVINAVDISGATTIVAGTGFKGTGGEVLSSTDGGDNWVVDSADISFSAQNSNAPLPTTRPRSTDPGLIQHLGGSTWVAATYDADIWRSTNNRSSWTNLNLFTGAVHPRAMIVDPNNANAVYVGLWGDDAAIPNKGLWHITGLDGTPTATQVSGMPNVVESLVALGNRVYAACGTFGVRRYEPSGPTVTDITGTIGTSVTSSAVHGNAGAGVSTDRVLVGTAEGNGDVWLSDDGGSTWSNTTSSGVSDLTWGRNEQPPVFADHPTWELGQAQCDISSLAISPDDADAWVVTATSAIWTTDDAGTTWKPADRYYVTSFRDITAAHTDGAVAAGNVDHDVMISTDDGATWDSFGLSAVTVVHAMDWSPDGVELAFANNERDNNTTAAKLGVAATPRTPATPGITELTISFAPKRVVGIAWVQFSGGTHRLVLAVDNDGIWTIDRAVSTWSNLTQRSTAFMGSQTNAGLRCSVVSDGQLGTSGGGNIWIYDRESGVWRSTNYGVAWTQVITTTAGEDEGYLAYDITNDRLYIATPTQVLRVDNATSSTSTTNLSFPTSKPGPMTFDGDGRLWVHSKPLGAGNPESRLYRTANPEAATPTWLDVADDDYRRVAPSATDMTVYADNVYVATAGKGLVALQESTPPVGSYTNSGSAGATWDMSSDGSTSWIAGPGDGGAMTDDAVDFSGIGHLETGTALTDPVTGDDATLSVLARVDTDIANQCFAIVGGVGNSIHIRPHGDKFVYAGWTNTGLATEASFDYDAVAGDGLFHVYTLTIADEGANNTARLYVDGTLVGSASSTRTVPALDRALVGAYSTAGDRRLDGAVAAVRVYDRVLTDTERAALYTTTTTAVPHDVTLGPLAVEGGPLVQSDPPPAWPTAPLDVTVELQLDGATWTNVTSYVYQRDQLTLTRGQSDEGNVVDPALCEFTVDNRDGRWSPRNPTGAWYGQIGRNVPVRVRVRRNATSHTRFVGELTELPVRWDTSGNDVHVPVVASGVLRRLQQGNTPTLSTYKRSILDRADVVAYWPFEDEDRAELVSPEFGAEPMQTAIAEPNYAGDDTFAASRPLPVLNDAELQGQVTGYTPTGTTYARFLLKVPDDGATGTVQSIVQFYCGGTVRRFDVAWTSTNGGSLRLDIDDDDFATIVESAEIQAAVNGKQVLVGVELVNNGSDVDYELSVIEPGLSGAQTVSGTISGYRVVRVGRVKVNNNGGMLDTVIGHITIHNAAAPTSGLSDQVNAYKGETAGRRIERICGEADVTFVAFGDLDDTTFTGPQYPSTLVDVLEQTATTDAGLLVELRDQVGVGYIPRTQLYNAAPAVTFAYTDSELAGDPGLEPTDDDNAIRNDVTAQQERGGSARYTLETGALSTAAPPAGVGPYESSVTINVAGVPQLATHAAWRVHLGTVDALRWPTVPVNLATPALLNDTAQTAAILNVDVGDRIRLTDLPAWLPPDDVDVLVIGYREILNAYTHTIEFTCVPAAPYDVAVWDTDRYDTAGSTLSAALTDSATSASVATNSGALWTTTDVPFDVNIGGEQITVTAVSGASSPQTFTITRSVNGVVKAHSSGDAVKLWTPAIRAL